MRVRPGPDDRRLLWAWRWANLPLPEPHLAALALGVVQHRRRPWRLGIPPALRHPMGWSLIGAGLGVVVASWTTAARTDLAHPDRLLVDGVYARTRNPMYLGWAALHAGAGLVSGSGWILAGLPAASLALHAFVRREEAALAAAFGEDYAAYRAAVPRYLPRPRPGHGPPSSTMSRTASAMTRG